MGVEDLAHGAASVMGRDLYSFPPLASTPAPIPAVRVAALDLRTDASARGILKQLHGAR
jgi:hypothetical protein